MATEGSLRAAHPAASLTERGTIVADRAWLLRLGLLYVALSLLMLLAMDRFWSNNWDVEIITQATRSLWDGGSPWDLYEKSRATWPWPYPYPPLSAWILVPFIGLADLLTGGPVQGWPQLIAIRVLPWLADIGIAFVLHRILWRATGERWIARLGALVWLFNPVLFYHSAVQGHQESTWMLLVLLAFEWVQERKLERTWWPMLLLVVAISLKQSAIFYVVPFGLYLLWKRRWRDVLLFGTLFGLIFGLSALPYYLYSDDFRALVFEEVRNMPVQVQSWQLWTLALPHFLVEQTRTTFFTVRYAAVLSVAATALLGGWALWKERSWYAVGLIGSLAFVLFSQKVMGYHYPMLLPWLIAFALRPRRFAVASAGLLWTSWVVVSPYFAPWAEASHLPFYAILGTLNTLVFGWLLWQALRMEEGAGAAAPRVGEAAQQLLGGTLLLALGFALATLAQPVATLLLERLSPAAPSLRLAALLGLLSTLVGATLLLLGPLWRWGARALPLPMVPGRGVGLRWQHAALALLFVPLFFTWFTMTAEVTSVLEKGVYDAWDLN